MNDIITSNTALLSAIGFFSPIVLPYLFAIWSKLFKKDLTSGQKKLFIGIVSAIIVLIAVGCNFDFSKGILEFIKFVAVNYIAMNGMISLVYSYIIKTTGLDTKLEESASKI